MEARGIDSGNQLAGKAKIAQSHIGRMRREESAATVDMLDALAAALGVQPWELLADEEATRRAAMERMLLGPRVPDDKAADHLPPAPEHKPPVRKRRPVKKHPPKK